ncbi:NAD(P)/FAD-dependent oxidoreductase [Aeromicrobium sp.]|uniref:flavin monoamine oxidase family protein n=1 Tax=Aeromicrobium sp. TaxID=1871063 RepID=UPI0030BDEA76
MQEIESDVVIIGAGASGLSAADALVADGFTVTVVEARDRVGGRLWTEEIQGVTLELGGQWVSPDQTALIDMIEELGLETYARYRDGDSIYVAESGAVSRFEEDFPVPASTQDQIQGLIETVDALVAEIDVKAPWSHPRAAELDSISWRDWLAEQTDDVEARTLVSIFVAEAMLTKPAHTFSLLQALLMAASAGSFTHLVDDGFLLDKRVVGGLQQVPLRLAARLGSSVQLGQAARRVAWDDESVVVTTDSLMVRAKRVIVAVPPNLYGRLSFEPALPAAQHQLHQHLSLGLVIKVHAVYDRPFWRDTGLSGTAFGPHMTLHEAYDNTYLGSEGGTLVGFVSDTSADAMIALEPDARREHLLECLATYFGPEALDPVVYFESDWASEEWTRGAYAASFDIGGLSRYGALLRDPVGPIHWSTSDLAAEGYQHVDGAIRIGRETATSIASQLGGATGPS